MTEIETTPPETPERKVSFIETSAFVWSFLCDKKRYVVIVLILLALRVAVNLAFPYLTGEFVRLLSSDRSADIQNAVIFVFIGILAQSVIYWAVEIGKHFTYDRFLKIPTIRDAGVRAFAKVIRFSTDWYANNFSWATVRKIGRGMWAMEMFMDQFYASFLPLLLTISGIIIGFSLHWPIMGVIVIAEVIIYTTLSLWFLKIFTEGTNEEFLEADSNVSSVLSDIMSCQATVRSFAQEEKEQSTFYDAAERLRAAILSLYTQYNMMDFVKGSLMGLLHIVALVYIYILWKAWRADTGDVVFVITSMAILSDMLFNIGNNFRSLLHGARDMKDIIIFDTLDTEPETPGAGTLDVQKWSIRFDDITFAYKQGQDVFSHLSLDIRPWEKVALVGSSGSGKSSLVKLLERQHEIQSGAISIDEHDISKVSLGSLRRSIAVVPQDPILFHRSLAENISYGKLDATRDEIIRAAKLAHAHEFIDCLPNGYDTPVGERGVKLSGGERQRVAIARAILSDCPILILDEATSALDSLSESLIQDALKNLMERKTVIIIAHRLSTIKQVDRIIVLDHGAIIEEGSHSELLEHEGGMYSKLYNMQAGGFLDESLLSKETG